LTWLCSALTNMPVRNCAKWLAVLLAIPAIGLHWLLFQSVAVVTMTVRFSQDAPFAVALAKTFNGKNPCGLCKFVNEGKAAESKQPVKADSARFDLLMDTSRILLLPPLLAEQPRATIAAALARSLAPPLPPPRQA
jgi:hypothetical protein